MSTTFKKKKKKCIVEDTLNIFSVLSFCWNRSLIRGLVWEDSAKGSASLIRGLGWEDSAEGSASVIRGLGYEDLT